MALARLLLSLAAFSPALGCSALPTTAAASGAIPVIESSSAELLNLINNVSNLTSTQLAAVTAPLKAVRLSSFYSSLAASAAGAEVRIDGIKVAETTTPIDWSELDARYPSAASFFAAGGKPVKLTPADIEQVLRGEVSGGPELALGFTHPQLTIQKGTSELSDQLDTIVAFLEMNQAGHAASSLPAAKEILGDLRARLRFATPDQITAIQSLASRYTRVLANVQLAQLMASGEPMAGDSSAGQSDTGIRDELKH